MSNVKGYAMKKRLFTIIIIAFIFISVADWGYCDYHTEKKSLKDLFISLAGNDWEQTFKGEWTPGDHCQFPGIETWEDNNDSIKTIMISGKGKRLLKRISPKRSHLEELEKFRNLDRFHLSYINFGSRLPGALWKLKSLTRLTLKGNNFIGKIPGALGNLAHLEELDLSDNGLIGPLPQELAKLRNLRKLDLSGNRLSGGIPKWIGSLKKLEELILDDNLFSGPIPVEICKMTNLKVIRLSNNKLAGNIPPCLQKLVLRRGKSSIVGNALYTTDKDLKRFLAVKLREKEVWEETQVVTPGHLKQLGMETNAVTIQWTSLSHTRLCSGYRIFCHKKGAAFNDIPVVVEAKTVDGTTKATITGLNEDTEYRVYVQAWLQVPAKAGNKTYKIESIRVPSKGDFTVFTGAITISGTIKEGETPVDGVEIRDGGKVLAKTDENGIYRLTVRSTWSGKLIPFKVGYRFNLGYFDYPLINAGKDSDFENRDYEATRQSVANGKVTYNDAPVGDIEVHFESSGKSYASITTEDDGENEGKYTLLFPSLKTGFIHPRKEGLEFEPAQIPVKKTESAEIYEGYDFTVKLPNTVKGLVRKRSNEGLQNVTVKFDDNRGNYGIKQLNEVITGNDGRYIQKVPGGWEFTATPQKKGYLIYPKRILIKLNDDIETEDVNFEGEPDFDFFLIVTGRYLWPTEGRFDDIYHNGFLSPEFSAGHKFNWFSLDFFVYVSWGHLRKEGETGDLGDPSLWKQSNLSVGAGYFGNVSLALGWRISLGVTYARYSETAMEGVASGNGIGPRLDLAVIYKISDHLFFEITGGALWVKDNFNGIDIALGNLRSGFGIGYRF